eukprot:scaffold2768_cov314-Prasinococcus_capsulatus_cf.AAC.14
MALALAAAVVAVARADEAADVAAACEYVENEMGMAQLAASMQMAYDNGLALGKTSSLVACAAQDLNFCGKPNFNACNEEAENPIFLNCPVRTPRRLRHCRSRSLLSCGRRACAAAATLATPTAT